MDQVSGACALPCRGPYLGHPAGGGTSWVDGNRALFAQAKTALGTGRAVVSESNAEVYLSSIDGFLSLYGWNNCGTRQPSCPTTASSRERPGADGVRPERVQGLLPRPHESNALPVDLNRQSWLMAADRRRGFLLPTRSRRAVQPLWRL